MLICRLLPNPTPMLRNLLLTTCFLWLLAASAQNPSTVIRIANNIQKLPCGATCTTITATVPHIKQSGDYVVQTVPFSPFAYDGGTELTALYADDIYSSSISLPFPVCFYGTTYNSLVVGSNGLVTFDVTNAKMRNNFRQTTSFFNLTPVVLPYAGGTQNSLASTYYPKAAIMGVYHDIFPIDKDNRRIEWRIEGSAPKRRFIASFRNVPMYSCNDLLATHQLVVYESTGVVEVYVQDKPICSSWNEGLAVLGMQNFERNKAVFPAGKNTGKWGSTGMREAYRFIPSAGQPAFKKAELLHNGTIVALADTASAAAGELALSFANICPAADSSQYLLRVTYTACNGSSGEVSFEDTLVIKKEKLAVSLQLQEPTCTAGGSITVNAMGTSSPLQYRLNDGPPQASPVFSNLLPGQYNVTVSNGNCTESATATLTLQDDLLLVAQPAITVCAGETFTPQILSNAASFSWSPSAGVSNSAEAHPEINIRQNTTYTLTATKGLCQRAAVVVVTVKPLPVVNAGPDQTIIQGDAVNLQATAPAGDYQWMPATGLSSGTELQPTATPQATTTYRLRATINGCSASDEATITVAPYCVKPMEAFTPNGDGINDQWLVTTGNCLRQAKVEVFNRYGARVYQNNDYKNNWSGQFDGKPLPDGTYYYLISYQLITGKMVQMKGHVTILR